ncbi:MAG: hypothetical protein EBX37_18950 [Alphaproteobacteria bacterium]|nr:hypothetical protein [Alphaproteobacteria bacterium]
MAKSRQQMNPVDAALVRLADQAGRGVQPARMAREVEAVLAGWLDPAGGVDAEVVAERLAVLHEQLSVGASDAAEQVADVDSSDSAAMRQAGLVHAALVAALHAVERARDAQRDVAGAATEMVAKPAPPAPMPLRAAVTIVPLAERNPQALQPTHPEELRVDVEPKPVTTGVQTKTPRAKAKRARKNPPKQDKDLYSAQG